MSTASNPAGSLILEADTSCATKTGHLDVLPTFTVEDVGVFKTPWSATITYRRPSAPLGAWPEFVCAENPHGYFPGEHAGVPTADKPDF